MRGEKLIHNMKASGYLLMALSMFLYALCEALEKQLTNTYEPSQIIFFRSSIALIFAFLITYKKGLNAYKQEKGLHLLRNLFASGALFLTIYSLKHLPLSSYGFMSFTSPIFISVFSYIFLKEKILGSVIIPIILSFSGALIMSYPFSDINLNLGFIFAFFSSIFYASACIVTKRIAHIDNFVLYATYTVVCFLISTAFSFDNIEVNMKDIPLFVLITIIHFTAFQCLIFAYRKEDLSKLSPLEYSTILWSILLGYLLWKHVPSYKELSGGLLILLGSIILKREELKFLFVKGFNKFFRN